MRRPMRTERKTYVKNSIGRMVLTGLAVLLQIVWFFYLDFRLSAYSVAINVGFQILALVLALKIYGRYEVTAFKLPWVMLLLGFPIFGISFYLLFGNKRLPRKIRRHFAKMDEELGAHIKSDPAVTARLAAEHPFVAGQSHYLAGCGLFPVYNNTDVRFFADAADGLAAQLTAMKAARRYIFLEYHAIEERESFSLVKEVLAKKAAEGVEIRILYDDVGSLGFIDPGFIKRMQKIGVKCRVFNPVVPFINLFMNNRDHRKITVIDGVVGFTGGYNLADEYFGITHPYGHWKDTGVELKGDAVASLLAMFFELWNTMGDENEDIAPYLPRERYEASEDCFVQPFADRPMDNEPVSENAYLNMIRSATARLYAATPYLIISDEMQRELCAAAARGVDVRILTPGIPDKKLIYRVTRSYYTGLARGGVRVFEYTPGFLHEKQMLCDDTSAIIGTINLDYRSLYHHFENGVLLCGCDAISDIAADFDATLEKCTEVTERYRARKGNSLRLGECLLRLLAPLL